MSGRSLQQLLCSGEYDEFEDIIVVEGEFIELDENRNALRQVLLGISPFHLMTGNRYISDYKSDPEVFYNTEIDPYLEGLEISSIVPLCLLSMNASTHEYEISITSQRDIRYYLLCNTAYNGHLETTWYRWVDRVQYVQKDPYHYIRNMLDDHDLPYTDEYMVLELEETLTRNESVTNQQKPFTATKVYTKSEECSGDIGNSAANMEDKNGVTKKEEGNKKGSKKDKKKLRKGKKLLWNFLYLKRKR